MKQPSRLRYLSIVFWINVIIDGVVGILEGWGRLVNVVERVLLDNIAATVPFMAPLLPAFLAYRGMILYLDYPNEIALVGAVSIEFLGLASVGTATRFWQFNQSKRKSDTVAPFGVALAAGVAYLGTVLTINVLLSIWAGEPALIVLAHVALSLLSVPAAVVVAIRASHARLLAEIAEDKSEAREHRRELREGKRATGHSLQSSGPQAATRNAPDIRALRAEQFAAVRAEAANRNGAGPMTAAEIREIYPDVPERTVWNWLERLSDE